MCIVPDQQKMSPMISLCQGLCRPVRGFATELCRAAVARRVADPGPPQGDNEGNGSTSSHLPEVATHPLSRIPVVELDQDLNQHGEIAHRLLFLVSGGGAQLMLRL